MHTTGPEWWWCGARRITNGAGDMTPGHADTGAAISPSELLAGLEKNHNDVKGSWCLKSPSSRPFVQYNVTLTTKKTPQDHGTGSFLTENPRSSVHSPYKWPVKRKEFSCHDVTMKSRYVAFNNNCQRNITHLVISDFTANYHSCLTWESCFSNRCLLNSLFTLTTTIESSNHWPILIGIY